MKEIGMGVVGCGFVGYGAHVPSFSSIPGAKLAAIADADEKRRGKAATKFSVDAAYADYRDLVRDPRVDAVVVSVPTPLHVPVALAAVECGKHVICEMPLATNLEDADRLIAAARQAGVVLMPSLTFRFTSNYVKVKQMIREGAIGTPSSVFYRELIPATDLASQWPASSWMWKLDVSGGPLFTLSVWSIDLVRWLFDTEIISAQATVKYTKLPSTGGTLGYDAFVSLRLANGIVGGLQYSGSVNRATAKSALEVVGDTTRTVTADDHDRVTLWGDQPERTVWNVRETGPRMWGHQQQNDYFVQCLREGRTPELTAEDGRRAMEVAFEVASGAG